MITQRQRGAGHVDALPQRQRPEQRRAPGRRRTARPAASSRRRPGRAAECRAARAAPRWPASPRASRRTARACARPRPRPARRSRRGRRAAGRRGRGEAGAARRRGCRCGRAGTESPTSRPDQRRRVGVGNGVVRPPRVLCRFSGGSPHCRGERVERAAQRERRRGEHDGAAAEEPLPQQPADPQGRGPQDAVAPPVRSLLAEPHDVAPLGRIGLVERAEQPHGGLGDLVERRLRRSCDRPPLPGPRAARRPARSGTAPRCRAPPTAPRPRPAAGRPTASPAGPRGRARGPRRPRRGGRRRPGRRAGRSGGPRR